MEKLRLNKEEKKSLAKEIMQQLSDCKRIKKLDITVDDLMKDSFKGVQKPSLIISLEAWAKMFLLVDLTQYEISWHGLVKRDARNQVYKLYDILVFPQENTSSHTGTDDAEYTKWLQNLMTDEDFPFEELRCHGHSHVNMKTFASATDDEYQNSIISNIPDGDFYIFMILNKSRSISVFLYDFVQDVMFTNADIDLYLQGEGNQDLLLWARHEMDKHVTEVKPNYRYYANSNNKNNKKRR